MSNKEKNEIESVESHRIHVNEFLASYPEMDPLHKAGLKAIAKKEWMPRKDWEDHLKSYLG